MKNFVSDSVILSITAQEQSDKGTEAQGLKAMEKRDARRIIAGYNAGIIYSTARYQGIIDNLSETGVNIITFPVESAVDFRPGESVDLKFEAPSGEVLNLQCKIRWSSKIHPHNIKHTVGMKIIDPQWEKTVCFL